MAWCRRGAIAGIAVTIMMVAGCGIHIPSDPSGTLARVTEGTLRAGISPNGDLVRVDGEPTGSEVDLIRGFARSLDAKVEWTIGSEEALVRGLDDGRLDLAAGGFTDQTPWTDKAGMTRPYAEVELDDGTKAKLVMLVPLGENAFLSRVELFLTEAVSG